MVRSGDYYLFETDSEEEDEEEEKKDEEPPKKSAFQVDRCFVFVFLDVLGCFLAPNSVNLSSQTNTSD